MSEQPWTPYLVDELKYNVHGNGFLQLQASSYERIHVWDDRVPHQAVPSLYHDHRFGFRSTILRGCLINVVLDILPDPVNGDYSVWTPKSEKTPNIDGKLIRLGGRYSVQPRTVNTYLPGDSYTMTPGTFHHTVAIGTTITRMIITQRDEELRPRVLCQCNLTPDNSFNRLNAMSRAAVHHLLQSIKLQELVDNES